MICDKLNIRTTQKSDLKSIRQIEKSAFGRNAEANLSSSLIQASQQTISLIAECDEKPVGHILMTEIDAPFKAMALTPLAVIPKYREMQVGSQLVRNALKEAKENNVAAVFVSGDPLYYERFGFSYQNASKFKGNWQGEKLMALELEPNALTKPNSNKKNMLTYPEAFFQLQ